MLVFLDFDGVLVDPVPRLYALYEELLEKRGLKPMGIEDYRALKRKPVKEGDIVKGVLGNGLEDYLRERMEKIEQPEYLAKDKLFDYSIDCLKKINENNTIILWTFRSNRIGLEEQLRSNGIWQFFDRVIASKDKEAELEKMFFDKRDAVIVGDTEREIWAAQKHSIKCIAVSSGLRSEKVLKALKPDFLVENLLEAVDRGLFG